MGLTIATSPAHAEQTLCANSEAEFLRNNACGDITDVMTRNSSDFMSRNRLFDGLELFKQFGFHEDFLWFAPERKIVGTDGLQWYGCTDNRPDGICDRSDLSGPASVAGNLGGNELHVFGERDAFIARVCGNMSPQGRSYNPTLNGDKFHDRNANERRDVGEEALAGWEFRITLVSPWDPAHQSAGVKAVARTDANGHWSFPLRQHGPGTYRIEEIGQDGWRATNGVVREVVVEPGIGDEALWAPAFGNVRETDSAKTAFSLVDPPTRIDADTPTDLHVKVTVKNNGPTDVVSVTDVVSAEAHKVEPYAEDCVVTPAQHVLNATLREGDSKDFTVTFTVLCTEPSEHAFTFKDVLTNDDDVQETRPADNTRQFTKIIPVWDVSDFAVSGATLDCPGDTEIEQHFTCTASATVTNHGPYGPTPSNARIRLTGLEDCTIKPLDDNGWHEATPLGVGHSAALTGAWDVVCDVRSFHPFTVNADVQPALDHVEDRDVSDNNSTASDTTEVFEDVDLEVTISDLKCSEREANQTSSSCDATLLLTNNGPADQVKTLLDLDVTPAVGCTATPTHEQVAHTLAAGSTQTVLQHIALSCTSNVRHQVRVDAVLRNDPFHDPHAVDSDGDALVWVPTDAKPRSFPSSVNVGKQGALPFAVVGTADLDPLTQIVTSSLRYGVTGSENSVTGCKTQGEDVDGDGRLDLVCIADTQLTGIACTTTFLQLTGSLVDGTRIIGHDEIKVLGCTRRQPAT